VTTRAQLRSSADTLERLTTRYSPTTVAGIRGNIATAERLLGEASDRADDAEARISNTGVNRSSVTAAAAPVSTELDAAAALVHNARSSLAAIDDRAAELAQAESTLAALMTDTRTDLGEAKAMRDNAPDAESGARGIERLGSAVAQLDTALASARNQQQRLEHARTALVGALVAARSQIGEAKSYMAGNRAGVDARTRLAEAERQLMLAESESDPVEALDAARRSATSARDADALARYRG
jgi:predicted  nucleic acid-binding Zn-ribbon protein